jgi:formylglycine-generating enzyme
MRAKFMCLFGLLILVSAITIGCGDDNENPVVPQVGAITVNPEPNSINAPWQMTGPNAFTKSAAGDAILADMTEGSYTLTWGAVDGWTAPSPVAVTQALAANGSLTFTGLYFVSGTPAGFVAITPGTFTMGSPTTEPEHVAIETQHQVTLTHGIHMQTTEVTNQQYRDLAQWAYDQGHVTATSASLRDNLDGSTEILNDLGASNSEITFSAGVFACENPTHPVKHVSWYGAAAYCDWLSLRQDLPRAYNHSTWQCNAGNPYTAAGYRLPTEAEWEYACRAGTQTPFNTGPCLAAGAQANYAGTYPYAGCPSGPYVGWTVPVGSYPANAFGLYDMHGNMWEWCNDWWADYSGAVTDPVGPGAGDGRMFRGGSWGDRAQECRSAVRIAVSPSYSSGGSGFRPVRSAN